jgi:hypothetical protein
VNDVETRGALTPVPFDERSRSAQVVLAGIAPAVLGALAGVMLGISSGAYWAVGAVAAIGGFLAGFEHSDLRGAAGRGAVAGAIYGAALLIAHAIAGTDAKVSLGSVPAFLVVITAVIGMVLAILGQWVERKRNQPR